MPKPWDVVSIDDDVRPTSAATVENPWDIVAVDDLPPQPTDSGLPPEAEPFGTVAEPKAAPLAPLSDNTGGLSDDVLRARYDRTRSVSTAGVIPIAKPQGTRAVENPWDIVAMVPDQRMGANYFKYPKPSQAEVQFGAEQGLPDVVQGADARTAPPDYNQQKRDEPTLLPSGNSHTFTIGDMPKDWEEFKGQTARGARRAADTLLGLPEGAAAVASGLAAWPLGYLAGAGTVAQEAITTPGKITAKNFDRTVEYFSKALSYTPRTEFGQTFARVFTAPFHALGLAKEELMAQFPPEQRGKASFVFDTLLLASAGAPYAKRGAQAGAQKIKDSSWFREATIRERGLVPLTPEQLAARYDGMLARGFSEAELARMSQIHKAEGIRRRMKPEGASAERLAEARRAEVVQQPEPSAPLTPEPARTAAPAVQKPPAPGTPVVSNKPISPAEQGKPTLSEAQEATISPSPIPEVGHDKAAHVPVEYNPLTGTEPGQAIARLEGGEINKKEDQDMFGVKTGLEGPVRAEGVDLSKDNLFTRDETVRQEADRKADAERQGDFAGTSASASGGGYSKVSSAAMRYPSRAEYSAYLDAELKSRKLADMTNEQRARLLAAFEQFPAGSVIATPLGERIALRPESGQSATAYIHHFLTKYSKAHNKAFYSEKYLDLAHEVPGTIQHPDARILGDDRIYYIRELPETAKRPHHIVVAITDQTGTLIGWTHFASKAGYRKNLLDTERSLVEKRGLLDTQGNPVALSYDEYRQESRRTLFNLGNNALEGYQQAQGSPPLPKLTIPESPGTVKGGGTSASASGGGYAKIHPKTKVLTNDPIRTPSEGVQDSLRNIPIPKDAATIVSSHTDITTVKAHSDYEAAKAGNIEAAVRLVSDMVKPETVDMLRKQVGEGAIFVAPHAMEASGMNAIPRVLARYYAEVLNGAVSADIVQSNRAFHTGASAMERLISPVYFDGTVMKGGQYVLVDDATIMGGTLADLGSYIQRRGGTVIGAVTLTNAGRTDKLNASVLQIRTIERRFGDEIRNSFGKEPAALTAAEAGYLVGFKDAHALRNRAVAAERQRDRRLRSKSVRASAPDAVTPSASSIKTSESHTPGGGTSGSADIGGYVRSGGSLEGIALPELVEMAKELLGTYPAIMKKLSLLKGQALGAFRHNSQAGKVQLKADIFSDPALAQYVLAHEIGHAWDWLPDHTLKRGNILGSIASLHNYMKSLLPQFADESGMQNIWSILTKKDRERLRREARKQAPGIDPALQNATLKPEDVTAIWNDINARVNDPKLYEWVSALPPSKKAELVKAAIQAIKNGGDFPPQWVDFTRQQEIRLGNIAARYKQMLQEEILKRRLFEATAIMDELKALTQLWKPFNESANARFTAYRYSPRELYADAISVLLNDPALLRREAPRFHDALFNWIERKPEVSAVYEAIQNRLKDPEAVRRTRMENLKAGFRKHNEAREEQVRTMLEVKKGQSILRDLKHGLLDQLYDTYAQLDKVAKENPGLAADIRKVKGDISSLAYVDSEVSAFLYDVQEGIYKKMDKHGLSKDDLGVYALALRIAAGDRAVRANPLGHTVQTAVEAIMHLRRQLGPEKMTALDGIVDDYWQLRNDVVIPALEKSGMLSPKLEAMLKGNKYYFTLSVTDAMKRAFGEGAQHVYTPPATIKRQLGTLKAVGNPFIETVLKDAALLRAAAHNTVKLEALDLMNQGAESPFVPADKRWVNKRHEWVLKETDDTGTLYVLRNGKLEAWYGPKEIVDDFRHRPAQARALVKLWQMLNQPLREVLVRRNPGWVLMNVLRDFRGTLENVAGLDVPTLLYYYAKAAPHAWADTVKDRRSDLVQEMYRNREITAERMFDARDITPEDALDRMMLEFGMHDTLTPVQHRNLVLRPILKIWNGIDRAGKLTERLPKIAAHIYLSKRLHLSPERVGQIVRERAGTPDFRRRGAWHAITNNLFLFSNVNKEGIRAAVQAAKENPKTWWWKQLKYTALPKFLMYAGLLGLLGDEIARRYAKVSYYNMLNYIIIPIGEDDNGKTISIRIPMSYPGQTLSALLWNVLSGKLFGRRGLVDSAKEAQPYRLSPQFDVLWAWMDYANGRNPQDDFTGQNVVSDQKFNAGGWRANQDMMGWSWNKLGGQLLYRYRSDDLAKTQSDLEKFTRVPPGTWLRFLSVENTGDRERLKETVTEPIRKAEANRQLDVKDRIVDLNNRAVKDSRRVTGSEIVWLYRDLQREGILAPTMRIKEFRHMVARYADRSMNNPAIDAVINAASLREKRALLEEYQRTMKPDEFMRIRTALMQEGFITAGIFKDAAKERIQHQRKAANQ